MFSKFLKEKKKRFTTLVIIIYRVIIYLIERLGRYGVMLCCVIWCNMGGFNMDSKYVALLSSFNRIGNF